jgi:5-methyltetrahydropteroyltriglutamate--homocysteine methyltransferase
MAKIYRTDQVGSLVRPVKLLDARDAVRAGRITRDQLRKIEDEAILETLEMQRQVGIDVFSDGEMRRDAWMTNFSESVEGFVNDYPVIENKRPDGTPVRVEMHYKAVRGKLRQVRRLNDAAFMLLHSPGSFKVTMPSPSNLTRTCYQPGITDVAYPTLEQLHSDTVTIVRGEMEALKKEGVRYLQLDEGFVRYALESAHADARAKGIDLEKQLAEDIAADNSCYEAVQGDGMTTAMHLCRGSRVRWHHGVGHYDWLAERLFNALHVDRFLLEYDTDVVGGFEPLRFMPKGKVAVLGIVSSKEAQLEKQDDLIRRIEDAAAYCPIEQLALSPQCGFQAAADRDGAHMSYDAERRKLELIVDTARKVWGQVAAQAD